MDVLCAISEDAHAFAAGSPLGVEAYTAATHLWQRLLADAGHPPLRHLLVRHLPLAVRPLGGPGFVLQAGGAVLRDWAAEEEEARVAPWQRVRTPVPTTQLRFTPFRL